MLSMEKFSDIKEEAIQELIANFKGQIIRPYHAEYQQARLVWNGMIDKYPALIARCANTQDVVMAVNFARDNNIQIAVRGGKHNVAGSATCDGGIVIDLSGLKQIEVNPANRVARAGGGVLIGELDQATQAYGLAVPLGVVTETGIAGLTLGGGLGWLRRKYGLTCDNLIGAEVVTADGRVVYASETENSDLLWGLRGGGGNFGIVTRFDYQLYPVGPEVFLCWVFYPAEMAVEALKFYNEFCATAPDEVSSFAILGQIPARDDLFEKKWHHKPFVVFASMYSGNAEEGEKVLQPLRQFAEPIADFSARMPYLEVQKAFDEDYPAHTMRYYWKSLYLNGLADDAINLLIELAAKSPSYHTTIDIWQLGGKLARVGAEDTAFGSRSAQYLIGIESNWEKEEDDIKNLEWNREFYYRLYPYSDGKEYLNFPGFFEGGDATMKATFDSNYQRLVELKNKYDPANLFNLNQNIKPSI
jgi:FAD/FMN-containing dehydrogenase